MVFTKKVAKAFSSTCLYIQAANNYNIIVHDVCSTFPYDNTLMSAFFSFLKKPRYQLDDKCFGSYFLIRVGL